MANDKIGTIGQELQRVQRQQDWAPFIRRTRPQWERLARKLLKQWRTSYALELGDVVQEMLVECVRAHGRFDPARGVQLGTYCVWCAMAVAKRLIHRDRQPQSRDRTYAPSRAPMPVSAYDEARTRRSGKGVGDSLLDRTAAQEVVLHEQCDAALDMLALAQTEQERDVMAALLSGLDLKEAGLAAGYRSRPYRRAYVAAAVCLSRAG